MKDNKIPSDRYMLECLSEEAAEVIQAKCKCFRFGVKRYFEGYGDNHVALSREVGDLLGVIDELQKRDILDARAMFAARSSKYKRIVENFNSIGNPDQTELA